MPSACYFFGIHLSFVVFIAVSEQIYIIYIVSVFILMYVWPPILSGIQLDFQFILLCQFIYLCRAKKSERKFVQSTRINSHCIFWVESRFQERDWRFFVFVCFGRDNDDVKHMCEQTSLEKNSVSAAANIEKA